VICSTSRWGRGSSGDRGELGLGDRVTVGGLLLVDGRLCEETVEAAREVALEAAQRTLDGLASASLRARYCLGRRVALGANDRDDVQRVVELMVPAAVEAVLVRWLEEHGLGPFRPELERSLQRGALNRPRVPLMRRFDAREREPRLQQPMRA
jgi:hypothetical protein